MIHWKLTLTPIVCSRFDRFVLVPVRRSYLFDNQYIGCIIDHHCRLYVVAAMSWFRYCSSLFVRVKRAPWTNQRMLLLTTEATVVATDSFNQDQPDFVRSRAGYRAKIIDGRALAKKVPNSVHTSRM